MINIYTSLDNLPKDKKFIFDTDAILPLVNITGSEFQRKVLREIESGEYHDDKRFKDRFGGLLYYTDMSTGSKALFVADCFKERIINFSECGENVIRLISYIDNCNIYIKDRQRPLPWDIDYSVNFDGRYWDRVALLNDYLR